MFWTNLGIAGQVYFCVACIASALLLVQLLLMIIGASTDIDFDVFEGDDGGIGLFTVKGLTAFFAVGGWSATGAIIGNLHWGWSIPIFLVTGIIALVGMGLLYKGMAKLQSNGVINPINAIGKEGEVYLRIPSSGQGHGKITIMLQEKLIEGDAITKGNAPIPTGAMIQVVEVVGDTYVVEPIEQRVV